ncbi:hypothetical protein DFA_09109 [Cavenderia fasciculata]|uniref:Tubulin-tyrosine ligase family protein n=1 Tax=Cavenderia fasciculata TaxID=261658 RepID=F4Q6Q2_CACFS|nr:uncharacterized protein DFA_09109 [Cavenderia fasciculata]EGG16562.1 hypothetical protein DFA_09109 [Cavenderia fasciculata]|eukprot:XP_004354962.1 hypothetical protein DFA_09109 [Cavenderia fasciculata]
MTQLTTSLSTLFVVILMLLLVLLIHPSWSLKEQEQEQEAMVESVVVGEQPILEKKDRSTSTMTTTPLLSFDLVSSSNRQHLIEKYGETKSKSFVEISIGSHIEGTSSFGVNTPNGQTHGLKMTKKKKKKQQQQQQPLSSEDKPKVLPNEEETVSSTDSTTSTPITTLEELEAKRWKTRQLLNEVFIERGFNQYTPNNPSIDFTNTEKEIDLVWLRVPLPTVEYNDFPEKLYSKIQPPNQQINRYPGMAQELNAKHSIAKNIKNMINQFGINDFNFHPTTFVLPEDYESLKQQPQDNSDLWIMKPKFGGRGTGIKLFNNTKHIPNDDEYVVQQYIRNPLLINGHKFTIRMYVLITSLDPLIVYIHDNGVLKFATTPFKSDNQTFNDDNMSMHITNQAVNSGKSNFEYSTDINVDNVGSRWSLRAYWKYLQENQLYDPNVLWNDIKETMVKALFSVELPVLSKTNNLTKSSSSCFQLLGVDMDLLDNYKPMFIEANTNPQLGGSLAPFDNYNKLLLIRETFDLLGYTEYDSKKVKKELRSIVKSKLQLETKSEMQHQMDIDPNHFIIKPKPKSQFKKEIDIITQFEYEKMHKGNYQIIYPTIEMIDRLSKYHQNSNSESNKILYDYYFREEMGSLSYQPDLSLNRTRIPLFENIQSHNNNMIKFFLYLPVDRVETQSLGFVPPTLENQKDELVEYLKKEVSPELLKAKPNPRRGGVGQPLQPVQYNSNEFHKDWAQILAHHFNMGQGSRRGRRGGAAVKPSDRYNISMTSYETKMRIVYELMVKKREEISFGILRVMERASATEIVVTEHELLSLVITSVSSGGSGGEDQFTFNMGLSARSITTKKVVINLETGQFTSFSACSLTPKKTEATRTILSESIRSEMGIAMTDLVSPPIVVDNPIKPAFAIQVNANPVIMKKIVLTQGTSLTELKSLVAKTINRPESDIQAIYRKLTGMEIQDPVPIVDNVKDEIYCKFIDNTFSC